MVFSEGLGFCNFPGGNFNKCSVAVRFFLGVGFLLYFWLWLGEMSLRSSVLLTLLTLRLYNFMFGVLLKRLRLSLLSSIWIMVVFDDPFMYLALSVLIRDFSVSVLFSIRKLYVLYLDWLFWTLLFIIFFILFYTFFYNYLSAPTPTQMSFDYLGIIVLFCN